MREKQVIKACYIRRGDVIRFDPFGVMKRQPRDEVYNPASSDAYDLRIVNIRLIGVCDFIVEGEIVRQFKAGGVELSQDEYAQRTEYLQNLPGYLREDGLRKINLSHATEVISSDNTQPYLRIKYTGPIHAPSRPIRLVDMFDYFCWDAFVYDELVHHFSGYIPFNMDIQYLATLLNRHAKCVYVNDVRFLVGVYNLRKFRSDLKRNVNRALMKITDAVICDDFSKQYEIESEGIGLMDYPPDQYRQRMETLREMYRELSQKWKVFDDYQHERKVRFDKLSRPHRDPLHGLSAQQVFRQEIRAMILREEMQADDEKIVPIDTGKPDDDINWEYEEDE